MKTEVLAAAVHCAAGESPDAIVRFLRDPPPPARVTLPDLALEIPYRLAADPDWLDTERLSRLAEPLVARVLEQAGLDAAARQDTALFIGSSSLGIGAHEAAVRAGNAGPLHALRNHLAESLAARFGLGAIRLTFNAACASAAAALGHAERLVGHGVVKHALVVGAESLNQLTPAGFSALRLLAANECRPFAADRDGMVLGEGVAAVLLGQRTGADWTLEAIAANCDPSSPTASTPGAMAAVMRAALGAAGVDPNRLRTVKVHGTGSRESDSAEGIALGKIFGGAFGELPLAGFKAAIGHTLGASALVELVLLMHAADANALPGAPALPADPALRLGAPAPLAGPGCYLLNTFGFGGNNAAIVMRKHR